MPRPLQSMVIGARFGRLAVVDFIGYDKSGRNRLYLCRCDCGGSSTPTSTNLINGNSTSCMKCKQRNKVNPKSAIVRSYGMYRRAAEARSLAFRISFEEFEFLIGRNCHYCGISPRLDNGCSAQSKIAVPMNGIDRLDSKLGYFEMNCVPCCFTCNSAKNDMSVADFEGWIIRVAKHLLDRRQF